MDAELPMREIKRRLSWTDFLAPLSEEELDNLLRRASFARLEEGEVLVVGPEEQAERMLLAVAGQLQVYEIALSSGRELTLWVLASGAPVGTTGLVPRWTRDLHIRALEPSVVCRIDQKESGEKAVLQARELQPDVVLMDLNMPGLNGIGATREILNENPDVSVLVLTMLEDDDSVFAAMRAGASGYLLKGARQEEVLRAIRAVANGEAIFGPGVARRVMGLFSAEKPSAPEAFPELTEREREVLALISRGRGNAEISAELFLSLKTVQNHVSNVLRKLRVADRTQAAILAREAGFGREDG